MFVKNLSGLFPAGLPHTRCGAPSVVPSLAASSSRLSFRRIRGGAAPPLTTGKGVFGAGCHGCSSAVRFLFAFSKFGKRRMRLPDGSRPWRSEKDSKADLFPSTSLPQLCIFGKR
jgi:hypothetical protein